MWASPGARFFCVHSRVSKTNIHKRNYASSGSRTQESIFLKSLFGSVLSIILQLSSRCPSSLSRNHSVVACIGGFQGRRIRIWALQDFKDAPLCQSYCSVALRGLWHNLTASIIVLVLHQYWRDSLQLFNIQVAISYMHWAKKKFGWLSLFITEKIPRLLGCCASQLKTVLG